MKDTQVLAIILASIIIPLAVIAAVIPDFPISPETRLKSFNSYEELRDFIVASSQYQSHYYLEGSRQQGNFFGAQPLSMTKSGDSYTTSLPEYSLTNVQVEGVDEADIVKTDGTYIYVVSNQTIIILKAYPAEDAEILSRIQTDDHIKGIFINDDKLVVLADTGYYWETRTFAEDGSYTYTPPQTSIKVYNIADRTDPTLIGTRNITVDGNYFNSRMIGDYVYILVQQQIVIQELQVSIPRITNLNETTEIPPTDIYYNNVTDNFNNYIHVLAVNLNRDSQEATVKSFLLGWASTMYVSQDNIYITYSSYQDQMETTMIHRINIDEDDITYEDTGYVPGYVLNQFSMDEYAGYFRIATTEGQSWGRSGLQNNVYILDMDLDTIGSLEGLAPGENIHSARFMGNRCYLVTFQKIDPLFVIDLADPTQPKVLGELKIPGYSDYLHPYDENHIIGIGKETVEGEGGTFSWYQGIKISLFDVSDVTSPKELAKYEIGDRGTDSPILRDHKAFLFNLERNLLVIPVLVAEIDPAKYPGEIPDWAYGDFVWDGAYVFHLSLEALELRGTITHLTSPDQLKTSYYYGYGSPYSIQRSLYIDNVLYTISTNKIKMNSLTDLTQIGEINLIP